MLPPSAVSIIDVVNVVVLYTGLGFLISRFLDSRYRNIPLTWLFLTLIFLPVTVSALTLFTPLPHRLAIALSALCWLLGLWVETQGKWQRTRFSLLRETHGIRRWEILLLSTLSLLFFTSLLFPKIALLTTNGVSVADDFDSVNKVLSLGYDLGQPPFFHFPLTRLSYYYYDYMLPGIVFQTTALSAQGAWFLHNLLEYAAILAFLLYCCFSLFQRQAARIFFFLSCTFLGGGFEYFLFLVRLLLSATAVPDAAIPDHLEWWAREFLGLNIQISAFYTLFLWVPQHLMGGMIYLLILLLSLQRHRTLNRIIIPILFAALLGFSTFVFITGSLSYLAIQGTLLWRSNDRWKELRWLAIQALLFLTFAVKLILLFRGRESILFLRPQFLHFLESGGPDALTIPHIVQTAAASIVNAIGTIGLVFFVDMGLIAVLGCAFFLTGMRHERSPERASLGFYALCTLFVTIPMVFLVANHNFNDFFMRGVIIAQLSLAIAAAFFLEKMQCVARPLLLMLALFFSFHAMSFVTEARGRSRYNRSSFSPLYSSIRTSLPKDAVVFLDSAHTPEYECSGVAFQGNRLCFSNTTEVGYYQRQLAEELAEGEDDYHDLGTILELNHFRRKYFLASGPLSDQSLSLVFSTEHSFLYKIRESL